jgi:hypothetical protein
VCHRRKATRSVETCLENKDDSDSELQSSSSATDMLNDSLAAANSTGRSSGHNAAAIPFTPVAESKSGSQILLDRLTLEEARKAIGYLFEQCVK